MKSPVVAIAAFTFLEAIRNRLFSLTIAGLVCLLGLAAFIGQLAIVETRLIQATLIGAAMRLFAACVVSLFVITSTLREFDDKGFELILSLPLPRYEYFFGKYLGYLLLSVVISAATAALLLLYCNPTSVAVWFVSLECELSLVIAVSLLCIFTFSNVTVSFMLVLAFYLLSRSMHAVRLIAASPILDYHTFSQEFMRHLLDGIAFVLPSLDKFTRGAWLAYGGHWKDLAPVAAQTVIYLVLLCAAALFDLYRKEL